jgi:hypothetical protein
MTEFCRNRIIKATKKEHECYDCKKIIPIGSRTLYASTRSDGYFLYGHFCSECVNPDTHGVGFGGDGDD